MNRSAGTSGGSSGNAITTLDASSIKAFNRGAGSGVNGRGKDYLKIHAAIDASHPVDARGELRRSILL